MLFIEFLGINTPIKQVYGDIAVVKNVTFVQIHKQILLVKLMHQVLYKYQVRREKLISCIKLDFVIDALFC